MSYGDVLAPKASLCAEFRAPSQHVAASFGVVGCGAQCVLPGSQPGADWASPLPRSYWRMNDLLQR